MPACNATKRWLCFTAILLLGFSSLAHATIFSVNNPRVDQIGNGYVLNAQIDYPLTPRVIEALHNGVPITFFQELKLVESIPILGRFWQWETNLWQSRLHYELRYHALSEQYVLKALETDDQQNFPHLEGALQALGQIHDLSLPPEYTHNVDDLLLLIRSGLDLSALPTPMRPGAMISSKWQLTSPWVRAVWP
ncbi:DUF4390 domain-containing protein [Methylophaga sp. OBS1]|uniref:DUF4390 domain-containing protein n=1 Tax=Methylophaga sp. OBS1 TaxID=2991933 RepID=UPI002253E71B|nr:DUF4390 domain-containing protein [Methylophaga sp. OBS1]MCX4192476.1 DUF4390 domain-containing protein [Methylophaga sp. OBS1]